jgi:hypothetical protein
MGFRLGKCGRCGLAGVVVRFDKITGWWACNDCETDLRLSADVQRAGEVLRAVCQIWIGVAVATGVIAFGAGVLLPWR